MSRRPFDPGELDQPAPDLDRAVSELEQYVTTTATDAPRGFEDRVMAAVEREPERRRSFLAWLVLPPASGGGIRRFARAGALAATLVLAVAGVLFAGQLADIVRHVGTGGSPTPSVSPSWRESAAPSPSTGPGLTPAESPSASEGASESPEPSGAAGESELESPGPSAIETPEAKTPRPSPTTTPEPSQTPTPSQ